MSIQGYYRWALLLPLVVPFLSMPLAFLGDDVGVITIVLQYSLVLGGIPYLLFAGAFLLWARGRSDARLRHGILLSPLVFGALMMLCVVAVGLVKREFWFGMQTLWMLGAMSTLLGYGYVILAEVGRVLLQRRGAFAPTPHSAA